MVQTTLKRAERRDGETKLTLVKLWFIKKIDIK